MTENKKVLNVVSVFFSVPFFFGNQLKYFSKKGYDIHLSCSPTDKLEKYAKEQGIKSKAFLILREFTVFQDIKTVIKLQKYIRTQKFDIVVGHTPKGALLSMLASFIARSPKRIFFRHGLIYETKTGVVKLILKNIERVTSFLATQVVCVSPYLIEKSLKDKLTTKRKLALLHIGSCNGVDALHTFNPEMISKERQTALRKELHIGKDNFVIGYVGRLVNDKGITELVDAFRLLKQERESIKLLLIGPREELDPVSQETLDFIDNDFDIVEVGHVEENLSYYYSLMNIFVLPTHREGLGTVCLEASSMRLPVLTNGKTGSRDAIIQDVTGRYIELIPLDIAQKIKVFMNSSKLCHEFGNGGREHMLSNFSKEVIWNEIENKVYKSKKIS